MCYPEISEFSGAPQRYYTHLKKIFEKKLNKIILVVNIGSVVQQSFHGNNISTLGEFKEGYPLVIISEFNKLYTFNIHCCISRYHDQVTIC